MGSRVTLALKDYSWTITADKIMKRVALLFSSGLTRFSSICSNSVQDQWQVM